MSDMIAKTLDGRDAIAYSQQTPWHKKGQRLTPGADIEVWRREAGLDYTVLDSPVLFKHAEGSVNEAHIPFVGRKVLYCSDNLQPLGVMSDGYNVVQPGQVLDFYKTILEREGAVLQVAGALDDRKRIWVLAKIGHGADILDGAIVEPYLLGATSFDGSMSTTFKFTQIEVVCHNTLTASIGYQGEGQSEKGRDGATIRVPHSARFDPDEVRIDLGICFDEWEKLLHVSRKLARIPVDPKFAAFFLRSLLPTPVILNDQGKKVEGPVEASRAYSRILALFNGEAMGADQAARDGTAYGLLGAVTEYVDHERGGDNTRLSSAWFGTGDGLKNKAFALLERVAA